VILLVAGCGGNGDRSPAGVVRAWSAALNASDNEGAARLFARDARVVQGTDVLVLHSHEDAVLWNASLPCSGKIVALVRRGYDVTATFLLADRKESICDGPGQEAVAIFRVRRGRIVLWHQLEHGSDSAPSA
jgi:limonene-1,2-epoxide hydrolase